MTKRSAPDATIVPSRVYEDVAGAIEWLCRVFGFTERLRLARDGVVSHAQLLFGNGAVMIGRQGGPFRAPEAEQVSADVFVPVDDVTRPFDHSHQCSARIVRPPPPIPLR